MSQNTSPDNVPSAKQGTADSLAAPGRVGAGGTNPQKHGKTVGCLCASCDQLPSLKPSAVGTKKRAHPDGCDCTTCTCRSDFSGVFELDPTLERFGIWLQARASGSAGWVRSMDPLRVFAEDVFLDAERDVQECLAAAKLLAQFKLEQGA